MGIGNCRFAHYRRLIVVFQPFGEIACRTRKTPSQDVGGRHVTACRHDEIDGRVLQQSERTRTIAR